MAPGPHVYDVVTSYEVLSPFSLFEVSQRHQEAGSGAFSLARATPLLSPHTGSAARAGGCPADTARSSSVEQAQVSCLCFRGTASQRVELPAGSSATSLVLVSWSLFRQCPIRVILLCHVFPSEPLQMLAGWQVHPLVCLFMYLCISSNPKGVAVTGRLKLCWGHVEVPDEDEEARKPLRRGAHTSCAGAVQGEGRVQAQNC